VRGFAEPRGRVVLRGARLLLLLLLGTATCAVSGPRTFRFASNLSPAEGRTCALDVLRRHGFYIAGPPVGDSTTVAMRAPARTAEGPGAWWRVEMSFASDADGRTTVTSRVGASAREEGPFTAPPPPLELVGSEITARCMWGPR